MSIEDAIYSRLAAHAGVSNLVGTRIYPLWAEQNASYPLVTYQRIAGASEESLKGSSGLAHPLFQISCFAATYDAVVDLSEQVRLALQGFSGTVASIKIQYIRFDLDVDDFDEEEKIWQKVMRFEIWYEETIPA